MARDGAPQDRGECDMVAARRHVCISRGSSRAAFMHTGGAQPYAHASCYMPASIICRTQTSNAWQALASKVCIRLTSRVVKIAVRPVYVRDPARPVPYAVLFSPLAGWQVVFSSPILRHFRLANDGEEDTGGAECWESESSDGGWQRCNAEQS